MNRYPQPLACQIKGNAVPCHLHAVRDHLLEAVNHPEPLAVEEDVPRELVVDPWRIQRCQFRGQGRSSVGLRLKQSVLNRRFEWKAATAGCRCFLDCSNPDIVTPDRHLESRFVATVRD